LIGFNCRTVDFVPHGLLEKVRKPFVVHSQIWLLGAGDGAVAGAGLGAEVLTVAAGATVPARAGVSAKAVALKFMANPAKTSRIMLRYVSMLHIIAQFMRDGRPARHRLVTTR
jgi:hypothetical protein